MNQESGVNGSARRDVVPTWLYRCQLTTRQLDLYANQLTRCLKALGTNAPIRADVQRELAAVRAEQESRASTV